jgi:hypothetical protein
VRAARAAREVGGFKTDRGVSQAGNSDTKLGAQVKLLERMQTLQAMLNTQKARRKIVAVVKQIEAEC